MDGWAASKARAAIGLISEGVFIFKGTFLKGPPACRASLRQAVKTTNGRGDVFIF